MTDIPQFKLDNLGFADDAELDAAMDAEKPFWMKYFTEGTHEVKIVDLELKTPEVSGDKTWVGYLITFEGVGGKTIKEWMAVPTSSIKYGKDQSLNFYRKLKGFLSAIGVEVNTENLGSVLTTYFGDLKALNGLGLKIRVGYAGPHAKWVKTGEGEGHYEIVDRRGNTMTGASGGPIVLPDNAAVKAYAQDDNAEIAIERFVSVLGHEASETPNKLGGGNDGF